MIAWRAGAAYPPAGPFVPVAGGRLATLQAGPERNARGTVVLIHGASANAADPMEGVGRLLAARGFRVIAFDRPGHGWSDRLGAATPAAQADRIAEALGSLDPGPVIVLGHSWGGAAALALALDHPERVSGLVLVAPVALPFPQRVALPWYWRLAAQPPVAWLLSRTLGPPLALYYLRGASAQAFRPQPPSEGYLERARVPLAVRPGALLSNVEDLIGLPAALERQSPRYGSLSVPVLIVSGDADPLVRIEAQAEPLAKRIPGARLLRLPGLGHMVPWVAGDRLAEAVADFLPEAASTR
ncbi:alpha/beta hydrolase [Methylobacterium radiodurans]|uniref:Alpha/beta hydrolase n=2 Tax=Methylobacterium radiodurans TaxID=2202828 RepID=A0A2U8W0R6_9HYPH|nr:alpha/beta hydrolase [Methylobacterium radiodurans]